VQYEKLFLPFVTRTLKRYAIIELHEHMPLLNMNRTHRSRRYHRGLVVPESVYNSSNFNPCGGSERVSFATMQALSNMDFDYDIITYAKPDLDRLENAYGSNLVSMIKKANKLNIVPTFTDAHINHTGEENKYHFHINTHPDLVPSS
jgi:hypothetical protein